MLFIVHFMLEGYALWQGLGAARIFLGLVPLLVICVFAAPVDVYRWFRDREKRARADARLADYRKRRDAAVARYEEQEPEADDYDENGVSYGP